MYFVRLICCVYDQDQFLLFITIDSENILGNLSHITLSTYIVRVASKYRTLARFGDFDFSPSAVRTTPSVPFYKVSELYALA